MHIAMLSDSESAGGAAVAASRLAEALCNAGHRVTRIVFAADGKRHCWETLVVNPMIYAPVARKVFALGIIRGLMSRFCQLALKRILVELQPQVINVHNLHGGSSYGWSPQLLRVCAARSPVVWTLHDMWSVTGRCAYPYDCRMFVSGCDATCPNPAEYPVLERRKITREWQRRSQLFQDLPKMVAVSPSRWLAHQVQAGFWSKHRVEVIPNGLPLRTFCNLNREHARNALGVATPGPVVLFAAHVLGERRKGLNYLAEALHRVSFRPFTILTMGIGTLEVDFEGIYVKSLGYLDDDSPIVLAYNAADFLVHPAPVDNLPNGVMEAISCGTPVVGFPIGGVPEMVRPSQSGWLAKDLSARALADAIEIALRDVARGVTMRRTCRVLAEKEYSSELQARRYGALYKSLAEAV